MNTEEKSDYKRIYKVQSGNFIHGSERSAIFAAGDHFLVSTIKGYYNEEYYRFFYSDLLALKVRIDRWANLTLVLLVILTVGFMAGGLFIDINIIKWICGVAFGIFSIIIAYALIYGPHVRLVFKTVTTEKDFPMGRQRRVMKMLAKAASLHRRRHRAHTITELLLEETNEEEKDIQGLIHAEQLPVKAQKMF